MANNSIKLDFLLKQYEKLKDEQQKRIEFRDRMIYITLGVIGGVFSFILEKPEYITALLVLPFICLILGWLYLMNDEKISEIGNYLRKILLPKIESIETENKFSIFPSWEEFHKQSFKRKRNKIVQITLDLLLFCVSALFSLTSFLYLNPVITCFQKIIVITEVLLIIYLSIEFIITSKIDKKYK